MSNEHQYLSLLKSLVNKADKDLSIRDDRTGTGTYSLFGTQLDFDLSNMKVPILTTKFVPFKTILHELYWMYILKNPNTNYLDNNNVKIWRDWSIVSKNNELTIGEMYGQVLRNFKYNFYDKDSHDNFDQIQYVINLLKDKPNTRRAVFSTFDPRAIADERLSFEQNIKHGRGVLNPCHGLINQFYINDNNELEMFTYQRSADIFLGLPFNIVFYSVVAHLIAQILDIKATRLVYTLGDYHLYSNHVEQAKEQLSRIPLESNCYISIDPSIKNLEDWVSIDQIQLHNYKHQGVIKAPVSV